MSSRCLDRAWMVPSCLNQAGSLQECGRNLVVVSSTHSQ
jgi:hypothetical protein